jgi:hypothetical protein
MLRQHVEAARAELLAIALAFAHRVLRRRGFQEFEAVARHQQRAARLVEPMVGAPDPLHQPRRSLGRAHLHDEIDIAPVDAQIEAGRGDQRAQFPRAIAPSTLRRASFDSEPW